MLKRHHFGEAVAAAGAAQRCGEPGWRSAEGIGWCNAGPHRREALPGSVKNRLTPQLAVIDRLTEENRVLGQ